MLGSNRFVYRILLVTMDNCCNRRAIFITTLHILCMRCHEKWKRIVLCYAIGKMYGATNCTQLFAYSRGSLNIWSQSCVHCVAFHFHRIIEWTQGNGYRMHVLLSYDKNIQKPKKNGWKHSLILHQFRGSLFYTVRRKL